MNTRPDIVNPDSAYKTYKKACEKTKVDPIEELDFVKGLAVGMSGILSIGIKNQNMLGMTKFPVDDDLNVWCLMVPCHDGVIRLIYGPIEGIDETIQNITNSAEQVMNENVEEVEYSSVDQF